MSSTIHPKTTSADYGVLRLNTQQAITPPNLRLPSNAPIESARRRYQQQNSDFFSPGTSDRVIAFLGTNPVRSHFTRSKPAGRALQSPAPRPQECGSVE